MQASVYIVRAFVQMRAAAQKYPELSRRIDEFTASCDDQFQDIFVAIRQLMATPATFVETYRVHTSSPEKFKGEMKLILRFLLNLVP